MLSHCIFIFSFVTLRLNLYQCRIDNWCIMKQSVKHFAVIWMTLASFGFYSLKIMSNEYTNWATKVQCQNKCERLGYARCEYKPKTKLSDEYCQCIDKNEQLNVLLN